MTNNTKELLDDLQSLEETHESLPQPTNHSSLQDQISAQTFLDSTRLDAHLSLILTSSNPIQDMTESLYLLSRIDTHIQTLSHNLVYLYKPIFPQLSQIIHNDPLTLAQTIQCLADHTDITLLSLPSSLSPANTLLLQLTFQQNPLPRDLTNLPACLLRCSLILTLDSIRDTLLQHISTHIPLKYPNLSSLMGPVPCAQLLSTHDGDLLALAKLSSIPFSLLSSIDLLHNIPASLHRKTAKLVTSKICLAARIDASAQQGEEGRHGQEYREYILQRLEQLQRPPPKKLVKPLPAPVEKSGKRRGGKRFRKQKEKYRVTQLAKQQNRMGFAEFREDEYQTGVELGMLGSTPHGNGALRVSSQDTQKLSSKAAKRTLLDQK